MARRAGLVLALVVAAGAACDDDRIAPVEVAKPAGTDLGAGPEFVGTSFAEFYPRMIAAHDGLAAARRSDWSAHFVGRWVRWTGRIASFTPTGMTLRGRPTTLQYDISVTVDTDARARLRRHHVGEAVTFVGRLKAYDDVYTTAYLDHGDIVER